MIILPGMIVLNPRINEPTALRAELGNLWRFMYENKMIRNDPDKNEFADKFPLLFYIFNNVDRR